VALTQQVQALRDRLVHLGMPPATTGG